MLHVERASLSCSMHNDSNEASVLHIVVLKETLHIVLQIHWFSMVQLFQTMVLFYWRTLVNLMLSHFSA